MFAPTPIEPPPEKQSLAPHANAGDQADCFANTHHSIEILPEKKVVVRPEPRDFISLSETQARRLQRRYPLSPARARLLAALVFGEARDG
jgi:hypothetical protein